MRIISHRGYWKESSEKNAAVAFRRSFEMGLGTETDVRDCAGKLVISHDMPRGGEMGFADMLQMADAAGGPLTLALNVKADGMAEEIGHVLKDYPQLDCFVFDMSVPDLRAYLAAGVPTFTRMSEVEREPAWLARCEGVWLDGFDGTWFDQETIARVLALGKRVCVVSSELHKRDPLALWKMLRPLAQEDRLILCTDTPEEAVQFFNING